VPAGTVVGVDIASVGRWLASAIRVDGKSSVGNRGRLLEEAVGNSRRLGVGRRIVGVVEGIGDRLGEHHRSSFGWTFLGWCFLESGTSFCGLDVASKCAIIYAS
jgi:hypothetical protein